jgi:hypothetical protein
MMPRHLVLPLKQAAYSAGLLLVVSNCSEVFGPFARMGTYDLTLLDGQPGPFILSDDHFSAGNRIVIEQVSDSIRIESPAALIRTQGTRTWFYASDGSFDTVSGGWSSTATYQVVGRRMTIVYPLLGSPIPPETLQVADRGILVGHRMIGGWCTVAQPPECPTLPHLREFTYEKR